MQKNPLKILGGIFEKEKIETKLKELEKISSNKDFWKDQSLVKKTVKQKKFFEDIINSYKKQVKDLDNVRDLHNLALEENDDATIEDCNKKIFKILKDIKKNETICFLSGENDNYDIYLEIHAGAGGTESQDWANILRRDCTTR